MSYDLLIKNGVIVDGSGMPGFRGDVAIKNGKIAELGKLSGAAMRTVDADGQVIAPGFVDNHTHFDAQVTWDPLCSFSPQHGATTVVFGNCSLGLAPIRPGTAKRVAEFLSYVEAIPMNVLDTVDVEWESIAQYMNRLEGRLGVNVGNFIGHTPVRYYVMGDDAQKRTATDEEIKADAGCCARRHEGGRARLFGLAQQRTLRSARRAHPGAVGRRGGDLRDRGCAARARHRHHPVRRRSARRS